MLTLPDFLRTKDNQTHSLSVGQRVRKSSGEFQHTGTIVAAFTTTTGKPRVVLEFDAPVAGMLHVYRPDQLKAIQ